VVALLGGLDDATALALREVVARHEALFLNIGSRADELRGAACHQRMFHVQPSDTMYAEVLAQWLVGQKTLKRWALVAADSPRGRVLGGAAAAALARGGGQVVAEERLAGAGDDARAASLRRAVRSGAEVVFLGMGSEEQLALARAARKTIPGVPLAGPGLDPGEFLSRDLLGVSGFWSTLWYHEWTRFSARELNRRFLQDFKKPMQGLGWAAWAGVRLLAEAAVRAEQATPEVWRRFLTSDYPFDGHKGEQLTVRPWDHQLRVTFGIVSPRPPEKAKGEADIYDSLVDNVPRDLDAVGVRQDATRCRFGS
jgi:ABC transporter substrate binding protein (PQQ-dependent alcohol dehydrogenase system)